MAVINILGKSDRSILWDQFLNDYHALETFDIEVFPIPQQIGFEYDSIGLSVHWGYSSKDDVIDDVFRFVAFFERSPYHLQFVELYNGILVSSTNIVSVMDNLLQ